MSSAATEQNNGDVAVEKIVAEATDAVDAVKDEKIKKPLEDKADNGTVTEKKDVVVGVTKEQLKGTKRPAEEKSADSKKAKKDKAPAAAAANSDCSDDDEIIEEIVEEDSDLESDEYDIPYDEDDVECDDDDDDNDVSGSDDQA